MRRELGYALVVGLVACGSGKVPPDATLDSATIDTAIVDTALRTDADAQIDARANTTTDAANQRDSAYVDSSIPDVQVRDGSIGDAQRGEDLGLRWRLAATTGPANGNPYERNSFWHNAMAYDPRTQEVVLFGGMTNNETWTWNGTRWMQHNPATVPSARSGHVLAFDSERNELILYGGAAIFNNSLNNNDTWVWSASTWTQRTVAHPPRVRNRTPMTYDSVRARMIVFGGFASGTWTLNDMLTYDGNDWTSSPANASSPTPRADHCLAYDPTRQRTVMFGGNALPPRQPGDHPNAGNQETTNQTWEWDGDAWTRFDVPGPAARAHATLVYSPTLGEVILFGGAPDGDAPFSDLWSWNGSRWRQISTPESPGPRYGHTMTFDAARGEVVVFGGFGWENNRVVFYGDETWVLR